MEKVCCDLCGSTDYKNIIKQTDLLHQTTDQYFNYVICQNCQLIYLNPRPNENEIGKYYSESYSFHKAEKESLHHLLAEWLVQSASVKSLKGIFAHIVIYFLNFFQKARNILIFKTYPKPVSFLENEKPCKILDIGCGAGNDTHVFGKSLSLISLKNRGFDVYGIEIAKEAREKSISLGIKNIHSNLFSANFEDDFFDIIRMNWSLEHMHSPYKVLKECERILKVNGKLVVSIPNYMGITYCLFPDCVEAPIHLFYFTVDTFKKYCEKIRLKINDYYTFSYPLLFLNACKIMGYDEVYKLYFKNFWKIWTLKSLLGTMKFFDKGDDMVFCLSKQKYDL